MPQFASWVGIYTQLAIYFLIHTGTLVLASTGAHPEKMDTTYLYSQRSKEGYGEDRANSSNHGREQKEDAPAPEHDYVGQTVDGDFTSQDVSINPHGPSICL